MNRYLSFYFRLVNTGFAIGLGVGLEKSHQRCGRKSIREDFQLIFWQGFRYAGIVATSPVMLPALLIGGSSRR